MSLDPVQFAVDLIRCPSVTPEDAGALDVLQNALSELGFTCTRLPFEEAGTDPVDNLYARLGTGAPHICFAGHTDVVPVGAEAEWKVDPFAGEIRDEQLWGRGAADMKGAIAAFVAATSAHLHANGNPAGSISLLITGDGKFSLEQARTVLEACDRTQCPQVAPAEGLTFMHVDYPAELLDAPAEVRL